LRIKRDEQSYYPILLDVFKNFGEKRDWVVEISTEFGFSLLVSKENHLKIN